MKADKRKRIDELECEIAVTRGVDAVRRRPREIEPLCHEWTIQRKRCARYSARSKRTNIHTPAAIGKPVGIANEHLDVSQQPMPYQDRFGMLQMRICGHSGSAGLFRSFRQN